MCREGAVSELAVGVTGGVCIRWRVCSLVTGRTKFEAGVQTHACFFVCRSRFPPEPVESSCRRGTHGASARSRVQDSVPPRGAPFAHAETLRQTFGAVTPLSHGYAMTAPLKGSLPSQASGPIAPVGDWPRDRRPYFILESFFSFMASRSSHTRRTKTTSPSTAAIAGMRNA